MSDWQIGDLAVCVDARDSNILADGHTYTVALVRNVEGHPKAYSSLLGRSNIALSLAGVVCDRELGFHPDRFRKVTPDKHESCEEEFTVLLRRSKPKVRA